MSGIRIGGIGFDDGLMVVAGPCVIESEKICLEIAGEMKRLCEGLRLPYVFKASFDKANRTSGRSFRGPGLKKGLAVLAKVKKKYGLPVLTDVHEPAQVAKVAAVVDVIQIPAFLCRQTDLLEATGRSGRPVNIKKGQFVSPWAMNNAAAKVRCVGGRDIILTERGSSFGYEQLVVDMTAIPIMRGFHCPVLFDVTHSLQQPPGEGDSGSGGRREYAMPLALAAVAAGADGLFIEVHPRPARALSDAATSLDYRAAGELLKQAAAVFAATR